MDCHTSNGFLLMVMFAILMYNMALCRHRKLDEFSLVVITAGANINCLLFW